MKHGFIIIMAVLIGGLVIPGVPAQPEWTWDYNDECMVFAMDFNDNGFLALAFGYYAILLTPAGDRVFKSPTRDLVYSIAISDNNYVLAGTRGNFVQLFDPEGKLVLEYKTGDQVWAVDISNDGSEFVAGSNDGWIYYFKGKRLEWKVNTGAPIWGTVMTGEGIVTGNDNGLLALYSYDGKPLWEKNLHGQVWRVRASGEYVTALSIHTGEVITSDVYLLTLNGTVLWVRHFDDYVRDVDVENGTVVVTGDMGEILAINRENETLWEFPNFNPAWNVALREGYTLAGGGGQMAFFLDPHGEPLWVFEDNLSITAVAMSPDGRYLAIADKTFEQINCMGNVYFLDRSSEQKEGTSSESLPQTSSNHMETPTSPASGQQRGGTSMEKVSIAVASLIILAILILLAREMRE